MDESVKPPKNYQVMLPDAQEQEIWDEAKYNRNKDSLFNDYKNAVVVETSPMANDAEIDSKGSYIVGLPGEAEVWDGEKLARNREQLLKDHPDVQIQSARQVNYWGDKLGEIEGKMRSLQEELKGLPQEETPADPRAIQGGSVAEMQDIMTKRRQSPSVSRVVEINRELNQLRQMRDENPAWQQYKEIQAEDIKSGQTRVEELQKQYEDTMKESSVDRALSQMDGDYLKVARRFYDDARKAAEAPTRQGDTGALADFWQGVKDTGWSAISLVDLARQLDNVNLLETVQEIQRNEGKDANIRELVMEHPEKLSYFSDAQKEMLRAFIVKGDVEGAAQEDLSRAYQAGQGAAKSLGFMADFMAAGGLGEAAAKKITGNLVDKAGRRAMAKIGAETLEGIVKAGVMTPLMPSSYSNFIQNITRLDDSDGVDLSGQAIAKAAGDVLIENISETVGAKPMELIGKPLSKVAFPAWAKAMRNSPIAGVMKQAGYNGFLEEMVEEWTGNAMRVMTGVDKDALSDFATLDQQLITAASFAPMALFGLGASTVQFHKASKSLRNETDKINSLIGSLPIDDDAKQAILASLSYANEAEDPEEFAHRMTDVSRQIVENGGDAADVFRASMDYATAASRYKVMNGVFEEQKDIDRNRQLMALDEQMGNAQWHHYGDNGSSYVRTITDQDGNERFVVAEDDTNIALVDHEGKPMFMSKDEVAAGVAEGTLEDSGETPLFDYLDKQTESQEKAEEQVRMENESRRAMQELQQAAQPGVTINVGTVENPVNATIMGFQAGNYIVQKEDGTTAAYTPQDLATVMGIRLTPETDAEIEAKEVTREERMDSLKAQAKQRRGQQFAIPGGDTGTLVSVARTDGGNVFAVLYNDAQGRPRIARMTDTDLESMLAQQPAPAQAETEAETGAPVVGQPATEEAQVEDTTPRDFRGNPLPLRTNTVTGEQEVDENVLWNNDPEAWVRYNDSKEAPDVTSAEKLEYTINDLTSKVEKISGEIRQAVLQGADQAQVDQMRAQQEEMNTRLSQLQGIFSNYSAQHAAEAEQDATTEVAPAEPVSPDLTNAPASPEATIEESRNVVDTLTETIWQAESREDYDQFMDSKATALQQLFDALGAKSTVVTTMSRLLDTMKANGATSEALKEMQAKLKKMAEDNSVLEGFHDPATGKIYIVADSILSSDHADRIQVHEEKHMENAASDAHKKSLATGVTGDELRAVMREFKHTSFYDKCTISQLADEVLAVSAEIAEMEGVEAIPARLRELGVTNEDFINFAVNNIDNGRRNGQRRYLGQGNALQRENPEETGRQDGRDRIEEPGDVGESGLRPDGGSEESARSGEPAAEPAPAGEPGAERVIAEEGVSSMSQAAQVEGAEISFSVSTEPEVEEKIRAFARTSEGKKAGWTESKIENIISETADLIRAIHSSVTGNKYYDEWAAKHPTVKVDWRDGIEKPTVTWSRANIEYKYDMSADLLCINNEGLETVLASPTMADLMLKMNETTNEGFTSEDYLRLYETLRDMGFVVPCKGCFDAAMRLKMLPSVARKFVDVVNKTIDERNKDPKKFDDELRAAAGENATIGGLPTSAKNKEDAIRIGVAGDNLTEHISWAQLMSAEGQTAALSNWGGIFRAWQRTGAGRPKDKLLPEPWTGDIVSTTTTIIGKYGEKTPSYRDINVNQGTGLRRNSHSEFRPILAIDEIQFMREAFIRGLTVFKYMKDLDDVRLFGQLGVKFNMSFFPAFVDGAPAAGLDRNGDYIAAEESVGGREFEYVGEDGKTHYDGMKGWREAQKYLNKDVSLSSVIFSIPHLIKALTDVPTARDTRGLWGSLIPFHATGATEKSLKEQGLGRARALGQGHPFEEAFTDYDKGVTNFEDVQNDRFGDGWVIVEGKKAGEAVTPGHKLEFANGTHYYNEALGLHLFSSFYIYDGEIKKSHLDKKGNIIARKAKNDGHPLSIDYNDKVREIGTDTAYQDAADFYIEELRKLGLIPRFDFDVPEDIFLVMCAVANVDPTHPKLGWRGPGNSWSPVDSEAYYSLWCDYGMIDPETGKYAPHNPVGIVDENGERVFKLPDNTIDIIKEGVERYSARKDQEDARILDAIEEYAKRTVEAGKLRAEDAKAIISSAREQSATSAEPLTEAQRKSLAFIGEEVEEPSIRPSVSGRDQEYLDAVQAGDMEKAQEMVLEAARRAMPNTKVVDENGNPKVVYHQTNATQFRNRETGQIWDELSWEERDEWDERDDWDEHWVEEDFNTFSRVNARTTNEVDGFFFAPEYDENHEYGDRTIRAFLNIENPAGRDDYNVDATYNDAGRNERIRLQNEGYDGIINEEDGAVYEYIAFNPSQIKSAEAVTYDNDGNIIPLSERFNPENDDIRFSLRGPIGALQDADAMANLAVAKNMEADGKDAKAIWAATGWEKGADGEWRNEIPDAKPKMIGDVKDVKTLGDIVDAPELFESYPSLKKIKVEIKKISGAGGYLPSKKTIELDRDYCFSRTIREEDKEKATREANEFMKDGTWRSYRDIDKFKRSLEKKYGVLELDEAGKGTLLHEMQHAIQEIEGFAKGGNTATMRQEYLGVVRKQHPELVDFARVFSARNSATKLKTVGKNRLVTKMEEAIPSMEGEAKDRLQGLRDYMGSLPDSEYNRFVTDADRLWKGSDRIGKELYRRLAGEVEARNVERRSGWSEEERRATPPSASEDYARSDQGVRFSVSADIAAKYPNWMDNQTSTEVEGSKRGQNTQVAGTVGTYKKVGSWIDKNIGKDAQILDASSGLGLGTLELRSQGFNVDDIEPYPGKGREEQPTYGGVDAYQKAMDDGKEYDYIISNAVLNVIPDDWRDGVLHDMATLLKPGGRMFINTRKAGEEKTIKNKIELESPQEVLVGTPERITSYQRFFTPSELKEYVESELGDGYTVEIANEKNSGTKGLAAVVVEKAESPRFSVTAEQDQEYMDAVNAGDMEKAQRMVRDAFKEAFPDTKIVDEQGNPIVMYHGTRYGFFNVFDVGNERYPRGAYFTSNNSDAKAYADYDDGEEYDSAGRKVYPVYLNIKYPMFFDNEGLPSKEDQEVYDHAIQEINDYGDAARKIIDAGYDGATNDEMTVAFFANQIKSAAPVTYDNDGNVIPLSERFNPDNDDIRFSVANAHQEMFVSNAQRAVENIRQEKATPEQWLKMVEKNGGLKAGEDKWLGLSDWLKEQSKPVTFDDYFDRTKVEWKNVDAGIALPAWNKEYSKKGEVHYSPYRNSISRYAIDKENGKIYRFSDHWGNVGSCVWTIDHENEFPEEVREKARRESWHNTSIGVADIKDFKRLPLTKQDILDYIEENKIRIEEVHYAEAAEKDDADAIDSYQKEYLALVDEGEEKGEYNAFQYAYEQMIERYGEDFGQAFYRDGNTITPSFDYYDDLTDAAKYFIDQRKATNIQGINPTRLDYTTRGLDNKREIALTVPTIDPWNQGDNIHFGDAGEGRAVAWIRFGDANKPDEEAKAAYEEAARKLDEARNKLVEKYGARADEEGKKYFELATPEERAELDALKKDEGDKFKESVKSRSAKNVLFIDEIQSKRHQEGRENGYLDNKAQKENGEKYADAQRDLDEFSSEMAQKYGGGVHGRRHWVVSMNDEEKARYKELEEKRSEARRLYLHPVSNGLIPAAPFEKNWQELAMKRMLRLAAEEGYDYVAWTTGNQQAERYNIGGKVDWIQRGNDFGQFPESVFIKMGDKVNSVEVDENGTIVDSTNALGDTVGKPLSDLLGKELAEKVMSATPGKEGRMDGEDLRVGGEGMKGFYDDMLPRFMNKYGKQWGVKVEDITLPGLENGSLSAHAVPVTQEMKDSVMEGQLMFSVREEQDQPEQSPVGYGQSIDSRKAAATDVAEKCGVQVEFKPSSEMQLNGKPLAGRWENGRISICPEHCRDTEEVIRTVLHEGVGHNGLRRLVGDRNMSDFCLDIFRALPDEERATVADSAVNEHGGNVAEAVEEYLARKAETMDFDNEEYEHTIWDRVRGALRSLLTKVGINVPLSENDVRWLLWQSYNANRQDDAFNEAKRQTVARDLGFTLHQQAEETDALQSARNRFADEDLAPAARLYNRDVMNWMNRLHETWVDKDDSVIRLVEALEKATGKKAAAFEDVRLALNQQSSKGLAAIEKFEREHYNPMMRAIKDLMKSKGCDLHAVERYVMIKHGLERNEVFARRDAREYYRDVRDKAVKDIKANDQLSMTDKEALVAKEEAKYQRRLQNIEAGTDVKYRELRNQDYGGLTAMYSEFDPIEPFQEGVESEEEYNARVLQARHPKYTTVDEDGNEQVDMAATEAAARQEVEDFENGFEDDIKELWWCINGATKATLKHQYDSNMISRAQYNEVKDMFQYYVPLRGFADKTAEDMYDYYRSDQHNTFTPPLQKAKGRKTESESPFGYIGAMASSAIAADMKNETKLALYYFVSNRAANDLVTVSEVWYEKTGEDAQGKSIFEPVYPPFTEGLNSEEAKKSYEDWEKAMQEKAKSGVAFKGTKKLDLKNSVIHIDDRQKASHVIKFKVGGRDMMMFINGNPRAAQAINNELNVEMSADYQKVFGKVLRWFSGINTSYNPEFWLSNAQRDILFALMGVNVKENAEYNKAFRKTFASIIRKTLTPGAKGGAYSLKRKFDEGELGDEKLDRYYEEFVDNGGVTGYTVLKNNEEWEAELRKYTGPERTVLKGIKTVFEKVQNFGEAIEQMSRFAAYATSRDMGKDIKDAVNDAKELTVNFNRKGSGKAISFEEAEKLRTKDGKKLNLAQKAFVVGASWIPVYGRRFIMFFNAAVQGLNAMYKLVKKDPGRLATWTAGYFALGVVQALIHAMLDDDDDYLDIPDYERRNNLLIGGDGYYFKWALPQESRIFYAVGDMAVNHMLGREPHRSMLNEVASALADIAPLNPAGGISALAPSAVTPFVEVALNRDFKGAKIYNDLKYLSDEERERTPSYQKAYPGTGKAYVAFSQFANWLSGGDYADAGWININPAAVEHILQGATGGAGTTLGKLYRGTVGQVLGEEFMVRNTPFLGRLLTVTDERYRNAHTTDLFDYYKAEAEHTKKRMKAYRKAGDDKRLNRLLESDDYQVMNIYESYKERLKWFNDELKATTDQKERRELMKEQDAVRKDMIMEISNIGNND